MKFMSKPDENEPKQYERPSERMFRRSRAAQARRRQAQAKESRFMRMIAGIAGFALLIVAVFFFMFYSSASAQEAGQEAAASSEQTAMTIPVIGNFTWLDIMGIAFVAVAGYAVWRKYQNKD